MHPVGFDDGPEPCDHNPAVDDGCSKCVMPTGVLLLGPAERDARADTDTGQYYCVTEKGGFVSRDGRPIFATLAEWSRHRTALPGVLYVPVTGGRRTTPLFGSVPLWDPDGAPDVVGDLVAVLDRLNRMADDAAERTIALGKIAAKGAEGLQDLSTIVSQRVHIVELLDRAAVIIDPDSGQGGASYEQRLDWLAKWREVVGR